jgi:hypothetical protein
MTNNLETKSLNPDSSENSFTFAIKSKDYFN